MKPDDGSGNMAADDGEELVDPAPVYDDDDESSNFSRDDTTLDSWRKSDADNKEHETRQSAKKKKSVAKKVLNSSNDIVCLLYYDRDDKEIKSLAELEKHISDNKTDPAEGIPEELVWVKYKHCKTDRDFQFELWTEIVIVGQRSMLKTWMGKRGHLKRGRGFP